MRSSPPRLDLSQGKVIAAGDKTIWSPAGDEKLAPPTKIHEYGYAVCTTTHVVERLATAGLGQTDMISPYEAALHRTTSTPIRRSFAQFNTSNYEVPAVLISTHAHNLLYCLCARMWQNTMEGMGNSPSDRVPGEVGKTQSRGLDSNTDGGFIAGNDHSPPSPSLMASSPPPFTATAPVQTDPGKDLVAVGSELSSVRPQHLMPVVGSLAGRTTDTDPHGSGKADRSNCGGGGGDGACDVSVRPSSAAVDERTSIQTAITDTVTTPSECFLDAATFNGNEIGAQNSSGRNENAACVAASTEVTAAEKVGTVGTESDHGGCTGVLSDQAPVMEGKIPEQPASGALDGGAPTGGAVGMVAAFMRVMNNAFHSERVAGGIGAGGSDPPVLAAASAPCASIDAPSASDSADAQSAQIAAPQGPTSDLVACARPDGIVQAGENAQDCAATNAGELGAEMRQSASGVIVREGQEKASSVDMGIADGQRQSSDAQVFSVLHGQEQAAVTTAAGIPSSSSVCTGDGAIGLGHRREHVAQGQDNSQRSAGGMSSPTQQPANPLPRSSGSVHGTAVANEHAMPAAAVTEVEPASVEDLASQEVNPGGRIRNEVVAKQVSAATEKQPVSSKESVSPAAELGRRIGEEEMARSVSNFAPRICSAPQPTPELSGTKPCPDNVYRDPGPATVTAVTAWASPSAPAAANTALAPAPGAICSSAVALPGKGSTGKDCQPASSGSMAASAIAAAVTVTGSIMCSKSVEPDEDAGSQDTLETGGAVYSAPSRPVFKQEPATNTLPLGACFSGEPNTFDTMDIAREALLYANAAATTTTPVIGSSNGPTAAAGQESSNGEGRSGSNNSFGSRVSSLEEAPQAVGVPSGASADALAAAPTAAEVVRDTGRQSPSSAGFSRVSTISRKGSNNSSGARKHRDDMMHVMCMICLEKLSDAADGGGAKLLGLLDSCTHRYCYTVSWKGLLGERSDDTTCASRRVACTDRAFRPPLPCCCRAAWNSHWLNGGGVLRAL